MAHINRTPVASGLSIFPRVWCLVGQYTEPNGSLERPRLIGIYRDKETAETVCDEWNAEQENPPEGSPRRCRCFFSLEERYLLT